MTDSLILLVLAIAPGVALGFYIYKKKRIEKKPVKFLLGLFGIGVAIIIPTIILEVLFGGIVSDIFNVTRTELHNADGFSDDLNLTFAKFIFYFFGVALTEEGLKWTGLFLMTRKSKYLNSLFDGIIFAAFVSLGFATFENIEYVMSEGLGVALLRMVYSVPAHFFFSVMMGNYYSWWNIYNKAGQLEKNYKRIGLIPQNAVDYNGTQNLVLSIVVPIVIHGAFDFFLSVGLSFLTDLLVVAGYVVCFTKVKKVSETDGFEDIYVGWLIWKKYPQLTDAIIAYQQISEENRYRDKLNEQMKKMAKVYSANPYMAQQAYGNQPYYGNQYYNQYNYPQQNYNQQYYNQQYYQQNYNPQYYNSQYNWQYTQQNNQQYNQPYGQQYPYTGYNQGNNNNG